MSYEPASKKQRLPDEGAKDNSTAAASTQSSDKTDPSSSSSSSASSSSSSSSSSTLSTLIPLDQLADPACWPSQESYEARSLVSNAESSVVIGTKGANVKALKQHFHLDTINIGDDVDGQGMRVMRIKGKPHEIACCLPQIAEVLLGAQRESREDRTQVTDLTKDTTFTLRLLVHHLQAGCIIGQGGSIVKEIKKATGAQISVSTNVFPGSTDKQVTVIASPAALVPACRAIYSQLVKNPLGPQGQSTAIPYMSREYLQRQGGGFFGGPRGPPGPPGRFGDMPPQGRGGPPFTRGPRPPMAGHWRQPGPPQGGPSHLAAGYGPPREAAPRGPPPQSVAPAMGAGGEREVVKKMRIPTELSGAVLGKSGAIIKDIKQYSGWGTRISLETVQKGDADREVTISGTARAVRIATDLIRLRLDYPNAEWPPPAHMMPASLQQADPASAYQSSPAQAQSPYHAPQVAQAPAAQAPVAAAGPYPGYNPIASSPYAASAASYQQQYGVPTDWGTQHADAAAQWGVAGGYSAPSTANNAYAQQTPY